MFRKRRPVRKKQEGKFAKKILIYALCVFVLMVVVFVLKIVIEPGIWQAGDRFIVLRENGDNSASFKIYEPQNQSVYEIRIPSSTQLTSSYNLGKWRLASLWKLYGDEGIGKSAMVDTFMLSMGLPADAWIEELSLRDRIKVFLFEFRAGKSRYIEIDPDEFGLIDKVRLIDGDQGYVPSKKIPGSIARLFASSKVLQERAKIGLKNYSNQINRIENISKVVEVLGTKIVSVENLEGREMDCKVIYKSQGEITGKTLANIYSCDFDTSDNLGSLDVIWEIGDRFWERY